MLLRRHGMAAHARRRDAETRGPTSTWRGMDDHTDIRNLLGPGSELTERQAEVVQMMVEVLGDPAWVARAVRLLQRHARLDDVTAEIVFTDALFDLLTAVAKKDVEFRRSPRAWLLGVARRKAGSRSELLGTDDVGRLQTVIHVPLEDRDAAAEPAEDEDARIEALRLWRELLPQMGWDLAEAVWGEILTGLETGAVILDVRTLSEILGRPLAAVKTAYYRGGDRLARLAVDRGLVDPRLLASDLVTVDEGEAEEADTELEDT